MKRKINLLMIVCCIAAVQIPGLCAEIPSAEQLIAEHLKSIAAPNVLSGIKTVTFAGRAEADFILGMSGRMSGPAMLVSQGSKMAIAMQFQDINYLGEYFAYDGRSVTAREMQPGQKSPIAEFLYRYDKIMKNGLLGGVFSNAWPLLDIKGSRPRSMKVGNARVDRVELYELEYRPRDEHGDMKIRLYFDPETYRHVRTEYKVRTDNDVTGGVGGSPFVDDRNRTEFSTDVNGVRDMAIMQVRGESFYTLVEKFDDFKKVGAVTLPHSYMLEYMIDGTNQSGFIANWKIDVIEIGFNAPDIDQKLFKAEK